MCTNHPEARWQLEEQKRKLEEARLKAEEIKSCSGRPSVTGALRPFFLVDHSEPGDLVTLGSCAVPSGSRA